MSSHSTGGKQRRGLPCGAGFSLIEVMLALMVISVGMLAILGLFPVSLDQGARAIAFSHSALFAEEIFSGLRACADEDWAALDDTLALPAAAPSVWDPGVTNRVTGADMLTNIYQVAGATAIVDHVIRYRLALTNDGAAVKRATLWVWSGQFGSTGAPAVFYGEFFNPKGH